MTEDVIKCVAVGDGYVGKTCLLTRLTNKELDGIYSPTVFDNSSVEVLHNGKKYDLHLIDTAGQEGYESLRTQAYINVNVFLVCFSVTNVDSFSNIAEMWLPEIKKHAEDAPLILVGTKSDLRNDPETIDRMNISQEIFVSREMALNLAKTRNMKYVECSARTKDNIQEVLNAILEVHLTAKNKESSAGNNTNSPYCIRPVLQFFGKIFCCCRER